MKEIAKIKSTFLGLEDHGIFTSFLHVQYGGSGQGVGGYSLDTYDKEIECRVGTAFGCEWIRRTLKACGVSKWEELPGRTIYVLKASEDWGAKVIGIGPLPTEDGEEFLFESLSPEQFYPEEVAA